jgi:hypothetical protein
VEHGYFTSINGASKRNFHQLCGFIPSTPGIKGCRATLPNAAVRKDYKMNMIKKMVLSAAVLALPYSAMAQVWGGNNQRERQEERQERRNNNNNSDFNQGYRQGRSDAMNGTRRTGRSAGNGQYRAGYEQGYRAAVQNSRNRGVSNNRRTNNGVWGNNDGSYRRDRGNDGDADDNNGGYRRGNGTWGNNGNYGQYGNSNAAYQQGVRDGQYDGQNDRSTGHSFRPTEHAAYKNADHGQSISGISRDQYKQTYRQGYERGYQQGYGSNGNRGR